MVQFVRNTIDISRRAGGALLDMYRHKRYLLSQMARFSRVGALLHMPTEYIRETQSDALLAELAREFPARLKTVLSCDPNWKDRSYLGLPCAPIGEVKKTDLDAVFILSDRYADVYFHFFNQTALRELPVIAPTLNGFPHRTFIRERIMQMFASRSRVDALEIGCIEATSGGHLTTRALAESILERGTIVSLDRNPLSISLAKYYCAGVPATQRYLEGDCFEILNAWEENQLPAALDFLLLHFFSDHGKPNLFRRVFELIADRLRQDAILVYQLIDSPRLPEGSLSEHLLANDYELEISYIVPTRRPRRYLVSARKRPSVSLGA